MSPAVLPNPSAPVRFYFDFISPFGYCASLRIDDIAARHGREVIWSSMLVGVTVMKIMKIPPIRDLPLKGAYQRTELARYLRKHGIKFGHSVNTNPAYPIPSGRAFHWLAQHSPELAKPAARALLDAYWLENRDIGDPFIVASICASVGANAAEIEHATRSDEGSALLRAAVDRSIAEGVFGSPFVIVDNEPFFGLDKLELVEEWLEAGGW